VGIAHKNNFATKLSIHDILGWKILKVLMSLHKTQRKKKHFDLFVNRKHRFINPQYASINSLPHKRLFLPCFMVSIIYTQINCYEKI